MYKAEKPAQMTFEDFNQSCGMKLNVHDEWVVVANSIDWASIEEKYMAFFPSKRGRPAVNARMALGALVIQHKAKLSDRNLVKVAFLTGWLFDELPNASYIARTSTPSFTFSANSW